MSSESPSRPAGFEGLPRRTLGRQELRALVDRLAERPELWREHVAFSDDRRHYASLYRDEHVDVWLLCWTPRNDTGWHDHDVSSGAVRVVAGAVEENNPRIGGDPVRTVVSAGASFCFGPDHIHRMTGVEEGSVTIHAYSPPLVRMGQYSVDESGVMRRTVVDYTEELRPQDEVPAPQGALAAAS
ncbi:cysteine dioxygenase type I [Actinomadura hallensis]|uniref:Cysteine dioxygenase type I n=1 Tax=Actinomadura hallensis TaxID=337895 RepID=A0A543IJB5_9ACTN|nr:cysteine dioxygenase family protein [Actinomadura hallensis]TQM70664.1 cysteine dioxygenase type I [Actinomadura hallensis]